MTGTPTRRSALLSTAALLLLVAPAVLGLTLVTLLFAGWAALAIPFFAAAIVYLYRLVVQSSASYEGKVVAREVGAAVLAIAVGFGAWVAAIVVGVLTEVLPFIAEIDTYPYADAWNAGSVVVGILVVPATWWLLRRLADPQSSGVGQGFAVTSHHYREPHTADVVGSDLLSYAQASSTPRGVSA